VQIFSVTGNVLDGVTDGMAEIQDGAQPALGFVLADHFGFDGAAARHDVRERLGFAAEQAGQGAFEAREQFRIVDDAVFDDLGETGAELAFGQVASRGEVASTRRGW